MSEPTADHPAAARWTHIALRVRDIDRTIAWYEEFTPLRLLDRREDQDGYGAWLGHPEPAEHPFILVLAQFFPDKDPFKDAPMAKLAPFAHLGIEVPDRADVDRFAAIAKEGGHLALGPVQMPAPIGYVCFVTDPDGNTIEYSHDQGVYAKAREVWG